MKLSLSAVWVPAQSDFDAFAAVSGDDNPIHVDPEFSAMTAFGRTVSHGMLLYTKLWGLLMATRPESRHLTQAMMFPNPCYTGEPVLLSVEGEAPGTLALRAVREADGAELLVGETGVA